MEGLHLIADLHDCRCGTALLCDAATLRRHCLEAVAAAGLHAVGELFHPFAPAEPGQPAGVTGVVLLAESHLALHTWPELAVVTLDLYVCNRSVDMGAAARQLLQTLQGLFEPGRPQQRHVTRSDLAAGTGPG